jgi:hypothetical protein
MELIAINPKNQKLVNKALKHYFKYEEINMLRDVASDNDDIKSYRKYDAICIREFDKYLEIAYDLPKGQQKAIDKFIDNK